MTNILEKIIQEKKETLVEIKKNNSLSSLENKIKKTNTFLDFKNAIINNKKISLISEIKKASPSAGILVKNFNHLDIAKLYVDNGATCLSVLTEEKNFLGKLDYIKDIKDNLKGKNAEYNAEKIVEIYKGKSNEFSQSVALNVAAGLIVSGKENDFKTAFSKASKHLASGSVYQHLSKLQLI